jgi:hypothetical protein
MRASLCSPDICSRESFIEWLPRLHTATFPYVQQFDSVDELFGILNALSLNVGLNTEIRQQMRRETLRLAAHNAGKWSLA